MNFYISVIIVVVIIVVVLLLLLLHAIVFSEIASTTLPQKS